MKSYVYFYTLKFATVHLWTFIVRIWTVLEVTLSSSSMSCKCGTIFATKRAVEDKIMEYGKNGLPFPFSFVIITGEYTLFPRVMIFATVKTI